MAWGNDGFWNPENVDVQGEVNKVASSGSPLMKQAAAKGQAKAAARGLGNSSIAASASQGEVLNRAIEIGGKQADIIGATNNQQLAGKWSYKTATDVQGMSDTAALTRLREGNAAEMARLDKQITANAALAKQGDESAMARLQADLASRSQLQAVDVASRERIAQLSESGANTRLGLELKNRTALQKQSDAAAKTRLDSELAARQNLSNEERATQIIRDERSQAAAKDLAQLDATTRLNIGQMEIDANAKNNALNAMVNLQSSYMTSLSQSMTNAKLPAGVRASFQSSLKDVTNAGYDMVRGITGVTMDWSATPATTAPTTTAPTTGLSSITTRPGAPA